MYKLRHCGIVTPDIKESMSFYEGLLGLESKKVATEGGQFIDTILGVKQGAVKTIKLSEKIELLQWLFEEGRNHIAFTVDNLNQEYKRLKKHGVKFISPPQINPEKTAKVCFCFAPEGTLIELVEEL